MRTTIFGAVYVAASINSLGEGKGFSIFGKEKPFLGFRAGDT